MYLTLFF